jgi:hypothetical protein
MGIFDDDDLHSVSTAAESDHPESGDREATTLSTQGLPFTPPDESDPASWPTGTTDEGGDWNAGGSWDGGGSGGSWDGGGSEGSWDGGGSGGSWDGGDPGGGGCGGTLPT